MYSEVSIVLPCLFVRFFGATHVARLQPTAPEKIRS